MHFNFLFSIFVPYSYIHRVTYPADADGGGEAGHHAEAALLGERQLVGGVDQHAHSHVRGQQRGVPAGVHVQSDAQTRLRGGGEGGLCV